MAQYAAGVPIQIDSLRIWASFDVAKQVDGIDPELLVAAETAALTVSGVTHVHAKGRWMGRSLLIEIEGFLASTTTIQAADELGYNIRDAIMAASPEVRAVLWSPHGLPT
jgi:divalent metal cation (Fe/Co/Zn/Cd) transporter